MPAEVLHWIVPALIGLGLSASCGLRVFLPFLVAALAARFGWLSLSDDLLWLSSTPALIALAIAASAEITAMQVPWLDHALDVAAAPAAVIGGAVIAASQLGDMDPMLRWSAALIAGGGAAGTVHTGLAALRATSTALTGGIANPVVTATETGSALALSLTAIFLPVAGVTVALIALLLVWRRVTQRRSEQG